MVILLQALFKKSKDTSDIVIPGTKKGKGPAKKGKSSSGSDTDVNDDSDSKIYFYT